MQKVDLRKLRFPDAPGVYIFGGARRGILYVGKAASLKSRVRSYFAEDIGKARGPRIQGMIEQAKSIDWQETDSVLEALILEANLIKKYQPPFNVREKDNKSFNYLVITNEDYPRVLVVRGRELFSSWIDKVPSSSTTKDSKTAYGVAVATTGHGIKHLFGPFPQGAVLKTALRIVRKIFPFRDTCVPALSYPHIIPKNSSKGAPCWRGEKPCFNAQIGLCPGVCTGAVSRRVYARAVRNIALLFEGKKGKLLKGLKKQMERAAKKENFEEAAELRRQIHALEHIQDIALIGEGFRESSGSGAHEGFRIEGYDIAHTSGGDPVGVMTVVVDGVIEKKEYRTFNIRTAKNNDTKSLAETLGRRMGHPEWQMPRLIVVDGGKGQLNSAQKALDNIGVGIPVVSVVKDERHKPKNILGGQALVRMHEKAILLANSEAHRFSLARHRKRRGKII